MEQEFLTFLQKEQADCQQREKQLIADERKDEANLCKVEANIYDIFAVLYQSSRKQAVAKGAGDEEAGKLFLEKAEKIPENWHASLEKAKEHHDTAKILTEEVKLKTVERIMETYRKMQNTK